MLDLITVKYMLDYFASPMKLFGRFGLACFAVAFVGRLATVGMKIAAGTDMTGNPLTLLAVLATIAAIQFFSLGLLGEVNARIYYGQPAAELCDSRADQLRRDASSEATPLCAADLSAGAKPPQRRVPLGHAANLQPASAGFRPSAPGFSLGFAAWRIKLLSSAGFSQLSRGEDESRAKAGLSRLQIHLGVPPSAGPKAGPDKSKPAIPAHG